MRRSDRARRKKRRRRRAVLPRSRSASRALALSEGFFANRLAASETEVTAAGPPAFGGGGGGASTAETSRPWLLCSGLPARPAHCPNWALHERGGTRPLRHHRPWTL